MDLISRACFSGQMLRNLAFYERVIRAFSHRYPLGLFFLCLSFTDMQYVRGGLSIIIDSKNVHISVCGGAGGHCFRCRQSFNSPFLCERVAVGYTLFLILLLVVSLSCPPPLRVPHRWDSPIRICRLRIPWDWWLPLGAYSPPCQSIIFFQHLILSSLQGQGPAKFSYTIYTIYTTLYSWVFGTSHTFYCLLWISLFNV